MKIKMLKDGAWMVNEKAVVFKKDVIYDLDQELAQKIIQAQFGLIYTADPIEPSKNPNDLITPENNQDLDLSQKIVEELDDKEKGAKKDKNSKK